MSVSPCRKMQGGSGSPCTHRERSTATEAAVREAVLFVAARSRDGALLRRFLSQERLRQLFLLRATEMASSDVTKVTALTLAVPAYKHIHSGTASSRTSRLA